MIDFDRFWMKGNSPYEDEGETPDTPDAEIPSGVTSEEILEWEREYGATLPEPIRTVLRLRNGGFVRNAPVQVLPLEEIVPVDDDFWRFTEIEEEDAPDHKLVFIFGYETQVGGTFLMNFNARGPEDSPSIYLDFHGESTYLVNDTIGGLFEAELTSNADPSVDWSEAAGSLPVIARESIDLSAMFSGEPASLDQVLARQGEALILFTRQRSPEGETRTRTTLPLPLDADGAEVTPHRPAPIATFALCLQPESTDGIVQARSEKNNDNGGWKNSTNHGVPIYVMFESTDRDRLEALRTQLFGSESAARTQAKQDRQTALEQMLGMLSPEQRTAALLQAALKMKQEAELQFADQFGDPGPVPPELAEGAALLRLKLEAMAESVRRTTAANPPDPETVRRIEGYLRDPNAK